MRFSGYYTVDYMPKYTVQFRFPRELGEPEPLRRYDPIAIARRMPEGAIGFRVAAIEGTDRGAARNFYVDGVNGMAMTRGQIRELIGELRDGPRKERLYELLSRNGEKRIKMIFFVDKGPMHLLRRRVLVVDALLEGIMRG